MRDEILKMFPQGCVPVGSRVTCDPAPTDTDEDYLCLSFGEYDDTLICAGFVRDGSPKFYTGNDNGGFRSFRRGDLNLIVTQDPAFFQLFLTATHLAKIFNLLQKNHRIALFQAILYGVDYRNLKA
jgi:hypothetical protein